MRISQRLFIRFWRCIYDYIPCFMRSISILLCRSLTGSVRQTSFLSSKERGTLGMEGKKSWKSSTNLWINLMMTSSETAIFSRMEPHATPRMTAWPKSKDLWWPDYFESLMAAKISWLKSAQFFSVGRLKRKSLCQQAKHHTGTGKQHSSWNCCD